MSLITVPLPDEETDTQEPQGWTWGRQSENPMYLATKLEFNHHTRCRSGFYSVICRHTVVGRTHASPLRCPHPDPQNPRRCDKGNWQMGTRIFRQGQWSWSSRSAQWLSAVYVSAGGGRKGGVWGWNGRSRPQSEALAGFEDGGRGHEPRNAGDHWKWKRQSKRFSPRAFRKQRSPAGVFTPVRAAPSWAFWPPKLENSLLLLLT